MRAVFADTFYFLALLNRRDAAHVLAIHATRAPGRTFVTTEAVLMELGDALNEPDQRGEFVAVADMVRKAAGWEVVPSSPALFKSALDLFRRHRDKEWQMTDCISFVIMRQRHLREALTGDAHFEQAGFKALLR